MDVSFNIYRWRISLSSERPVVSRPRCFSAETFGCAPAAGLWRNSVCLNREAGQFQWRGPITRHFSGCDPPAGPSHAGLTHFYTIYWTLCWMFWQRRRKTYVRKIGLLHLLSSPQTCKCSFQLTTAVFPGLQLQILRINYCSLSYCAQGSELQHDSFIHSGFFLKCPWRL